MADKTVLDSKDSENVVRSSEPSRDLTRVGSGLRSTPTITSTEPLAEEVPLEAKPDISTLNSKIADSFTGRFGARIALVASPDTASSVHSIRSLIATRIDDRGLRILKYSVIALPLFLSFICLIAILEIDHGQHTSAITPELAHGIGIDSAAATSAQDESQSISANSESGSSVGGSQTAIPAHHLTDEQFEKWLEHDHENLIKRRESTDPAAFTLHEEGVPMENTTMDSEIPSGWLFKRLDTQSEAAFFRRPRPRISVEPLVDGDISPPPLINPKDQIAKPMEIKPHGSDKTPPIGVKH